MSDAPVVVDISVMIHFMEGDPLAGKLLLGRRVHVSVATEIELRTMGAIKRNAKDVCDKTLVLCARYLDKSIQRTFDAILDKMALSTPFTLSFDQLLERFPLTAERFRFSKNWKPNKEKDVAVDLVAFLGKRDFVIQSTMIFEEDAPASDDPIGYELDVKIKSHPVDVGEHWFTDLDEARLHALDFVLEIFEEEQKGLD